MSLSMKSINKLEEMTKKDKIKAKPRGTKKAKDFSKIDQDTLCIALATVPSKPKARDHIEKGRKVYLTEITDGEGNTTKTMYSRCIATKSKSEDGKTCVSEYCTQHAKKVDNDEHITTIEDLESMTQIDADHDHLKPTEPKKSKTKKSGSKALSRADIISRLNSTDDKLNLIIAHLKIEVPIPEDKKEDEHEEEDDGDKLDIDKKADDDSENEAMSIKNDDDDYKSTKDEDEAVEAEIITCEDGSTKYGLDGDLNVYESNGDEDAGDQIGRLMETSWDKAPIIRKGNRYIVGKEFVYKDREYIRCVHSKKAFHLEDDTCILVGSVNEDEDGNFKITYAKGLDKKYKA